MDLFSVITMCTSGLVLVYQKQVLLGFAFLALYALFATVNSSLDAIKYAQLRAKFIEIDGDMEG